MDMAAAQQRTMKEFLELYNKITYHCFDRCISNFNHSRTSGDEMSCVDSCADKFINFNQRHMMVFVDHQNTKQKLAAKAAEESQAIAAAAEATAAAATEATEAAAAAAPNQGEATPQLAEVLPESQGLSPLVQPAVSGVGEATSETTPVLQNACYHRGLTGGPRVAVQPVTTAAYPGKSIIERFLSRGTAETKIV